MARESTTWDPTARTITYDATDDGSEVVLHDGDRMQVGGGAGNARFLSEHALEVNGREIHSKYFLIATGAHPRIPDVHGIGAVPYITYKSVFDLDQLPESLIVMGAGPIGIEIAQAFERFGTAVTVVGETLLPRMSRRSVR